VHTDSEATPLFLTITFPGIPSQRNITALVNIPALREIKLKPSECHTSVSDWSGYWMLPEITDACSTPGYRVLWPYKETSRTCSFISAKSFERFVAVFYRVITKLTFEAHLNRYSLIFLNSVRRHKKISLGPLISFYLKLAWAPLEPRTIAARCWFFIPPAWSFTVLTCYLIHDCSLICLMCKISKCFMFF
jgi:hypothetical protein